MTRKQTGRPRRLAVLVALLVCSAALFAAPALGQAQQPGWSSPPQPSGQYPPSYQPQGPYPAAGQPGQYPAPPPPGQYPSYPQQAPYPGSQQPPQYGAPPPQTGPYPAYGQPAPATPPPSVTQECNQYAASQAGNRDKTTEVAKDSILGGLGGAGLGAAIGAIAGGGRGAARGAAIGGGVGIVGGALYGINENNKNDEAYRAAYASCMRARGYQ